MRGIFYKVLYLKAFINIESIVMLYKSLNTYRCASHCIILYLWEIEKYIEYSPRNVYNSYFI